MQKLSILNSKQVKGLRKDLEEQYGYTDEFDYVVLKNETKEKLYLFTKDLADFDFTRLRIDSMGLYFGAYFRGRLRLTIEGSQIIGPGAKKNVLELSEEQVRKWMLGCDLESLDSQMQHGDFVICKRGLDYLGCGKISGNDLMNYVPKTRYVHATFD